MRPRAYDVLEMAVENGITRGYRRAFKHTDSPSEEDILESLRACVMGEVSDWFVFDDGGGE